MRVTPTSPVPKVVWKDLHDYCPATWLALVTALSVDDPALWGAKLTGADCTPAELPAVPTYGSIRLIVALAVPWTTCSFIER